MSLLLFPLSASALQTIDSIDITVELFDDGSIGVTQVWDAYSDEGSEFYIVFQRLDDMEIIDYTVEDETGRQFEYKPNWDIHDSFEDKAYKYGENHGADGYELNFGKSVRGDKTYIIKYTMTNAVQAFPDMDGFNIRFINDEMDPAPDDIRVEIFKEGVELTPENSRIWGFGYEGETAFVDGKIIAENSGSFNSDNHVTLLLGLEKGILQPVYQGAGTFEQLKDRALKDSSFEKKNNFDKWGWMVTIGIMATVFLFIVIGIVVTTVRGDEDYAKRYPKNRKKVKIRKRDYHSDIPLNGYLPGIFYFYQMRKSQIQMRQSILSAYFLKWVHDGALNFIYNPGELKGLRGFISQFKTHDFFEIVKEPDYDSQFERDLWAFMVAAAGDEVLDNKELEQYVSKKIDEFEELFTDIFDETADYAIAHDLLDVEERKHANRYDLTDKGFQALLNVHQFKNYLNDYTLARERNVQEVHLWDEYLIIATLLGIGDKVAKQFQEIMPEYHFSGSSMSNYDTMILMHNVSTLSSSIYSSYESSSGGEGSSSLGGGGGFSGGGSGGGGR